MGVCRIADGFHRLNPEPLIPMKCSTTLMLPAVLAAVLTSCSSVQIPKREITRSEPSAAALVSLSQRAHGWKSSTQIRDVTVSYEGRWASLGPKFQPVVADTKFRGGSEERLLLPSRVMAQEHSGPAGKKFVLREPGKVAVSYNGKSSDNAEVRKAAALVADAYTMFLLGPAYFNRPGVVFASAGEAVVDKAVCDGVLAVLRPGFGEAKEDRVLLYIDRSTKQLRRVRMTLNGLESTQGAEVDVTFRDFRRIDGILWPTDFDERIRVPFDLHAHHWKLLGLETNRGYSKSDLGAAGFKGRASAPTALPALSAKPR